MWNEVQAAVPLMFSDSISYITYLFSEWHIYFNFWKKYFDKYSRYLPLWIWRQAQSKPAFKKLIYKKLQAHILSIRYLNIRNWSAWFFQVSYKFLSWNQTCLILPPFTLHKCSTWFSVSLSWACLLWTWNTGIISVY